MLLQTKGSTIGCCSSRVRVRVTGENDASALPSDDSAMGWRVAPPQPVTTTVKSRHKNDWRMAFLPLECQSTGHSKLNASKNQSLFRRLKRRTGPVTLATVGLLTLSHNRRHLVKPSL